MRRADFKQSYPIQESPPFTAEEEERLRGVFYEAGEAEREAVEEAYLLLACARVIVACGGALRVGTRMAVGAGCAPALFSARACRGRELTTVRGVCRTRRWRPSCSGGVPRPPLHSSFRHPEFVITAVAVVCMLGVARGGASSAVRKQWCRVDRDAHIDRAAQGATAMAATV
eukprot:gene23441-33782_t